MIYNEITPKVCMGEQERIKPGVPILKRQIDLISLR